MNDVWGRADDVVGWTLHDGPGRPVAGPSDRSYGLLAAAWVGWAALAFAGCMLFHGSDNPHVDLPVWLDVAAVAFLLGVPVTVALLAAAARAGAWVSAVVGFALAPVSMTQLPLVPAYTLAEAAGFCALGAAGLLLALADLRSRRAEPAPAPVASFVPTRSRTDEEVTAGR